MPPVTWLKKYDQYVELASGVSAEKLITVTNARDSYYFCKTYAIL